MGINGLLPVVKPICQERHVQDLAHTRVGVDVYGWLHKGAFSCALNLCRGIDTVQFVHFCMHRVRMLIHFKATPVMVFDGADLPMKAGTHNERRERREEAMGKAEEAFARGDKRKAEEWYQRAYTVTSEMARQVIRECRKLNVEYVVAPYEADAQLAWMMKTGYIDAVITEDSDMLVYGASKILFKMNRFGNGDLYDSKNLLSLDSLNMSNFTEEMFLYMAVCSGCDFFKGVQGLGIKKSHTLVKRFRTMARLIIAIRQDRRFKVQKSFAQDFTRACLVFRHQTVFDMRTFEHIHLNKFDDEAKAKLPHGVFQTPAGGVLDLSFLGAHRDAASAKQIAEGLIHPRTLEKYMDPLDIVSRPVTTRVRTMRVPSPPRRRRVETDTTRDVRGFQVQPASAGNEARYTSSLNLRQRLSSRQSGAQVFNPRRVGAAFRAKHGSSAGSAAVWTSFRSSAEYARSSAGPSGNVAGGRDDVMGNASVEKTHTAETKENESLPEPMNRTPSPEESSPVNNLERQHGESQEVERNKEEEQGPSNEDSLPVSGEDPCDAQEEARQTAELPGTLSVSDAVISPKRRRVTSSHRVEAVNRAIDRFAKTEKKDLTKKFMSSRKTLSDPKQASDEDKPPSSKEKKDDLFEEFDAVAARPDETQETPSGKKTDVLHRQKSLCPPKPKIVSQLRLSRFFKPLKQNEKGQTAENSRLPNSRSLSKHSPTKQKKGIRKTRKQTGSSFLNQFRRGAIGKTAVVRRKPK